MTHPIFRFYNILFMKKTIQTSFIHIYTNKSILIALFVIFMFAWLYFPAKRIYLYNVFTKLTFHPSTICHHCI